MYQEPVDPIKEAKKSGIKVYSFDGEGILNGMIAKVDGETFISVDKNMNDTKQRVVCAHELGHFITDTIQAPSFPRLEHMANRAAREMMIPEQRLREIIKDYTEYACLASFFGVSARMIEERCRDLGIGYDPN